MNGTENRECMQEQRVVCCACSCVIGFHVIV